jgi:hypothetical protein
LSGENWTKNGKHMWCKIETEVTTVPGGMPGR